MGNRATMYWVETVRGIELGEVITVPAKCRTRRRRAAENVLRLATEDDLRRAEANAKNEKMAFDLCLEKIVARASWK